MECNLKNITVHYEVFGEGRPIVMLHGWDSDHRQAVDHFEPVFSQRDGWRRIYPDLPGMGKTRGEDWITSSDDMLDVMTQFVDGVIPGQRFALASISYGSYLARGLAHRRAAILDGAVFVVPIITPDKEKRIRPQHNVLVRDEDFITSLSNLNPQIIEAALNFVVVQNTRWLDNPWMQTYIAEAGHLVDARFLTRLHERYALSVDLDTISESCSAPMLFLLGRQDTYGYPRSLDFLKNYPRASFAILDRAGHGLWLEQPLLYKVLLNEWLDRVEEWTLSLG